MKEEYIRKKNIKEVWSGMEKRKEKKKEKVHHRRKEH